MLAFSDHLAQDLRGERLSTVLGERDGELRGLKMALGRADGAAGGAAPPRVLEAAPLRQLVPHNTNISPGRCNAPTRRFRPSAGPESSPPGVGCVCARRRGAAVDGNERPLDPHITTRKWNNWMVAPAGVGTRRTWLDAHIAVRAPHSAAGPRSQWRPSFCRMICATSSGDFSRPSRKAIVARRPGT